MKTYEMDNASGKHWEEEKCIKAFVAQPDEETDSLEDLSADGRIILKWMLKNGVGRGMN
jgi:hypothetical protein